MHCLFLKVLALVCSFIFSIADVSPSFPAYPCVYLLPFIFVNSEIIVFHA